MISSATEPKTIGALLRWTRQTLAQAGIDNYAREAVWLLEYGLDMPSHHFLSESECPTSGDAWTRAQSLVGRRAAREPLQYILGTEEFCGLTFGVNADVLIPRPETELLVQEVVRRLGRDRNVVMVDAGTGSGCLAVSLAVMMKQARILAIDRSPRALVVAQGNAMRHNVASRIEWLEGDLLEPLKQKCVSGAVNVIVSNPPYISEADWAALQPEVRLFEPRMALVGGRTGTEFYERLLSGSREFLAPRGLLVMEVGQGQAPFVRDMVRGLKGYGKMEIVQDAAHIERVVIVQRID